MGLTAVLAAVVAAQAPPAAPVEVMVLGTYHMSNPGRDVVNATIDPVTTLAKQAELAAVATALARFRPTAVALEQEAADPTTMADPGWPHFTPADLTRDANERVQLGYRLAQVAGVTRVWAIDVPGEFPFPAVTEWAQKNGRAADLDTLMRGVKVSVDRLSEGQKTRTVASLLRELNDPATITRDGHAAPYYGTLSFGRGTDQPGADLNTQWYGRNARIFARLVQTARPGDRVVVIYGAGHAYWLRHFAATTPGFRLVEPNVYLPTD